MNSRLSITPSAKTPFAVNARVVGYDAQTTLHWGDGSAPTHTMPGRTYEHQFPAAGRYMITCVDGSGVLVTRQQVAVTGTLTLDEVHVVTVEAGVRISFTDVDPRLGVAQYRIDWPDGDIEQVWGVPGHVVRHDVMPGTHELKITDTASGRSERYTVHVTDGPVYEPDFTVHRATDDEHGMTVYVRLTRVDPSEPVYIQWDDADGPQYVHRPTVGMEIPHSYAFPGHYMQTVRYAHGGHTRTKSEAVTVPYTETPGGWSFRELRNQVAALEASSTSAVRAERLLRRGAGGNRWRLGVRAGDEGDERLAIEGPAGAAPHTTPPEETE